MFGVSKTDPNYGKGVVELDVDFVDEAEVRARLEATFASPDYKPPTLPSVAMEVLGLSQQPDVDFPKVAKVMEKDAMITGQVLRIAQSPTYAGRAQITSIQQALSRMGIKTLRDIVLQVAMNARVFRAKPYQKTMESLKRHSTAVAHTARIVSRYTSMEGEYAFLCGLLHDVGVAAALIALAEQAGRAKKAPALEDVWPAVDAVHADATRLIVEQWRLPADIAWALSAHHTVLIQGYPHPMAATVRLADEIADKLGYGIDVGGAWSNQAVTAFSREQLLDVLNLTEKQVGLLEQDAAEVLAEHAG